MTGLNRILLAVLASLAFSPAAQAHPHVWVTMTSQLVYAPDGAVTGVRHTWTFDDMYSTFALEGVEQKTKGVYTREELTPLAEVNVTSLKEYDFFSYAKANGKKVAFTDPVDYWLDYKNETLTLHFTLPFKSPVKAKDINLEVYDPTYFVDFAFAEKDPVALVGAPAQCKFSVERPHEVSTAAGNQVGESFFNDATSGNWGAQFANKVSVKCP
jgi:ABC-type uncharacterized transport system substrate-binding protein